MLNSSRSRLAPKALAGRMPPKYRLHNRALRQEYKVKELGKMRFADRFKTESVKTVRSRPLPRTVNIASDPQKMDSEYLVGAMHRCATMDMKDLNLWRGYASRALDLRAQIRPEHYAYLFGSIGRVGFVDQSLMDGLFNDGIAPSIEYLPSASIAFSFYGLMKTNVLLKSSSTVNTVLDRTLVRLREMKGLDLMMLSKSVGYFGFKSDDIGWRSEFSAECKARFDTELFAQDFKNILSLSAFVNVWTDEMRSYILERISRIHITLRPNELRKAYLLAVAARLKYPNVWFNMLSFSARRFYAKLAERHIPMPRSGFNVYHRYVSNVIAKDLGLAHRNTFRWGPFMVDIGFDEGSRQLNGVAHGDIEASPQLESETVTSGAPGRLNDCLLFDKPCASYYHATNRYTENARITHELLSKTGWAVRRCPYDAFVRSEDKKEYIHRLLLVPQSNVPSVLRQPTSLATAEVLSNQALFKEWMAGATSAEKSRDSAKYRVVV